MLLTWLLLSVSVYVTAQVLPGFRVEGFAGALVIAALLGALNLLIGWLLFFAIGVGTLGLGFLLAFVTRTVVTAILLKMIDGLSKSLSIRSFGTAFFGALIMSFVGTLGEALLRH